MFHLLLSPSSLNLKILMALVSQWSQCICCNIIPLYMLFIALCILYWKIRRNCTLWKRFMPEYFCIQIGVLYCTFDLRLFPLRRDENRTSGLLKSDVSDTVVSLESVYMCREQENLAPLGNSESQMKPLFKICKWEQNSGPNRDSVPNKSKLNWHRTPEKKKGNLGLRRCFLFGEKGRKRVEKKTPWEKESD